MLRTPFSYSDQSSNLDLQPKASLLAAALGYAQDLELLLKRKDIGLN